MMKSASFLTVLSCLVVGLPVCAPVLLAQEADQSAKAGQAREGTPDSSITSRVDKIFEKLDRPDSPGCALGVVKDGQLIYKRGYGMANLDNNIPISPKSVFQIASMSKQFTAMSILLLAKQGKLSLDDEIQKYLPEVPRYQSPITIRHLIHHTSGIRNYIELLELAGMRGGNVHLTDDDLLGLIARQKELNFKPGKEYLYSNSGFFLITDNRPPSILTRGEEYIYSSSGYFLLGLIVKRVSGMSLREFAGENIFKPLGMKNTHFHDDRTLVVKNRVTAYLPNSNGGFSAAIPIDDPPGDGGLYTSVEDLFLWDQNFYNNKLGGGPDLISEQLSTGMLNNGGKINYAFGIQVQKYKDLKTISHGGGGSGFRSHMIRFPEQNFSVICLCNAGNTGPVGLANQVADIFLADQFKKGAGANETIAVAAAPDMVSIPETELASLTGLYVDLTGLYVDPIKVHSHRLYMKDGKLMVYSFVLSPLSRNRFNAVGAQQPHEFVFIRPVAGGPMQVKEIQTRSDITTTIDEVQRETLTSVQLTEFTGKYVSDELAGATYTLSVKDGKLSIRGERGKVLAFSPSSAREAPEDFLLTPAFADAFLNPGDDPFIIKFIRNQQNAISAFTLNTTRLRGLRFDRVK
jgi:CubicO group peptidase (beta-lactamase class C family)